MSHYFRSVRSGRVRQMLHYPIEDSNILITQAHFDGFIQHRRVSYHGENANTSKAVAILYRGQAGNTCTNYLRATEDVKYSRDLILSKPGVFQRLRMSARSSYWYGRILRVYLSTVMWNLRKNRFFTSLSRVFYSLSFLLLSARHMLFKEFWEGLRTDHVPDTLHFVMKDFEQGKS